MANWQFLIQKEGDRAWLPIQESHVPLESGRYRLVAQSSLPNQPVQLRVRYQSTEEKPPRQRSLTRRTTADGLIVVIPYTNLKPGLWEFSCAGKVSIEDSLQPWEEKMQLQVQIVQKEEVQRESTSEIALDSSLKGETQVSETAQEVQPEPFSQVQSDSLEEVQSDSTSEITLDSSLKGETPTAKAEAESLASQTPDPISEPPETPLESPASEVNDPIEDILSEISEWGLEGQIDSSEKESVNFSNAFLETSLQDLEQILQEEIDPLLRNDSEESLQPSHDFAESSLPESEEIAVDHQVQLHLDTDAFMSSRGDAISKRSAWRCALSGHIETLEFGLSLDKISAARLRYQLRNPQDRKLLQDVQHSLSNFTLPYSFHHTVTLEEDIQPRLLLGDAIVEVKFSGSDGFSAIASQSFTVTLDVSELLETVFPPVSSSESTSETQKKQPTAEIKDAVKIKFFNPSKSAKVPSKNTAKAETSQRKPAFNSVISHKIPRETAPKSVKTLQLPNLPSPPPVATQEKQTTITIEELPLSLSSESSETMSSQGNESQPQQMELESSEWKDDSEATVETIAKEEEEKEALEVSVSLDSNEAEKKELEREKSEDLQKTAASFDIPTLEVETSLSQGEGEKMNVEKASLKLPNPKLEKVSPVERFISEGKEEGFEAKQASLLTGNSLEIHTPDAETSPPVEAFISEEEKESVETKQVSPLTEDSLEIHISDAETSPPVEESVSQEKGEKVNVEESFQALSLQKRFLERLNSLAKKTDSSEWLQDEPEPAETVEENITEDNSTETQVSDFLDDSNIDEWEEMISPASEVEDSFDETETVNWEESLETNDSTFDVQDADPFDFPLEDSLETSTPPEAEITEWEEATTPLLTEEEILAAQNQVEFSEKMELTLPPNDWGEINDNESEKIELTSLSETWEEETPLTEQSHDFLLEEWEDSEETPLTETEEEEQETWVEEEESNSYTNPADKWSNLEVVVDDEEVIISEPPVTPRDTSGLPYPIEVIPPKRESPLFSRQRLEVPVPTPVLTIPEGTLTAGETVVLKVKLAPYSGSVYVKLWIQDRQTRAILDGPRALVDFEESSTGDLATLTQLTVPLGTMEVQFEAIAIDTQTQQESHKTVVDKIVTPSDLPSLSLDEFEV